MTTDSKNSSHQPDDGKSCNSATQSSIIKAREAMANEAARMDAEQTEDNNELGRAAGGSELGIPDLPRSTVLLSVDSLDPPGRMIRDEKRNIKYVPHPFASPQPGSSGPTASNPTGEQPPDTNTKDWATQPR